MALFSQCFALSAFSAPLLAGRALDSHGHGSVLWLATSALCLLGLPLLRQVGARGASGAAANAQSR
jgi:hypothetical protein